MRTLKFRLWNLEDKRWDNPSLLEVWDDSGKLEPFEYSKSGTLNPLYTPKENYIIQQYTDAYDSKGREIYEGDLVSYRGRVGLIEYFATMFICSWTDQTDDELSHMMIADMNVIGNIFENRELYK